MFLYRRFTVYSHVPSEMSEISVVRIMFML